MSEEIFDKAVDIHWKMVKSDDRLLNQKEAIAFLKISQHELNKIRRKKELPFQIHKGCYFYAKVDCVNWLLKHRPDRLKRIEPK